MAPSTSRRSSARSRRSSQGRWENTAEGGTPAPSGETTVIRLLLVWGFLILTGFGLVANLFHLQVSRTTELSEKARQQQIVYLRPFVPRRSIIDRRGDVLAIDEPVYTLYVHPKLFKEPEQEIANKLSPFLGRAPAFLLNRFRQQETGVQLEYAIAETVADQIENLGLDGVELQRHQKRVYPQGNLAADVVGYVNLDRQGQAGVEYSQQKLLERTVQVLRFNRTGTGTLIPDREAATSIRADDLRLQLTLDLPLQRVVRSVLAKQVQAYRAKRGSVIVMDARDGAILSLVAEPSYDPNAYSTANIELFKNWAVTDLYEPGSTFKPLNTAIALEAKAIKPDDIFNDEGRIYVNGWPIEDYDFSTTGGRGRLSVSEILQHSSNVGMVHIVQQMQRDAYYGWLERLGLGKKSEIDLPFESKSQLKDKEKFVQAAIEPATTSFGQGFSLTPIQLVQMHAALANGGQLVTPHVVQGLLDSNNQLQWQPTLPAPRRIFSPRTARTVVQMMEDVVSKGTGKVAQIPGYRIAGKTGTAQKADPNGGYYSHAKITSFVAILPVEEPRYVVMAVIDEPKGDNAFGSTVAAPIVKAVMEALIATDGLPPAAAR
ncbi:MAG: penicillin-binding protein 2 [Leptolyngbyaceae cyanobacterium bins.59]|nr:penicillin-binding protein 2 [Leptolyngbyaceae cyanobacterium bins.59]